MANMSESSDLDKWRQKVRPRRSFAASLSSHLFWICCAPNLLLPVPAESEEVSPGGYRVMGATKGRTGNEIVSTDPEK